MARAWILRPGTEGAHRAVNGWIDRFRYVLLALFTAAFLATTVVKARAKPFWHDEIFTVVLAGLPSLSATWSAFRAGIDLSPPMTALATRMTQRTAGPGPVASRLPSIVAFWTASLLVYAIVRRRTSAAMALAAALLLYHTAAYRFAIEARGYSLALAGSALACYGWLEAASVRRRKLHLVLLAAGLAAAVWAHYFAVLTALPIVAGEAVRAWRDRRVDWGIAGALAAAAAATLPLVTLATAGVSQAPTFWTRQTSAGISETYYFLISPMLDWVLVPAAVIVAIAALFRLIPKRSRPPDARPAVPTHEIAAGGVAFVLPACAVVVLGMLGPGMVPRYAIFATAAMVAAAAVAIWRIADRPALVATLLCVTLVLSFGQSAADSLRPGRHPFVHPVQSRPVLVDALRTNDPLVVSSGIWFLQLWYYATPDQRARLMYIGDPALARELTGADTLDRGYLGLSTITGLRVNSYRDFTAGHRDFHVYTLGSHWLLDKLRQDRAVIEEVAREPGSVLYHVRMP
jgi:dolichyl-phosphate-mannose-protein mannosyltransferase